MLSTKFKRGFLRKIYREANAAGESLLGQLELLQDARFEAVKTGFVLVSTSANGRSAQLAQVSANSGLTAESLAELSEELLTRYDEAETYLIAEGTASPTDAQIFTEMLRNYPEPIRELQPDFGGLVRV